MCAYKALDVADYIVQYCNTTGKKITHLQLQKILYFSEAKYLVNNSNLFDDTISKWRMGPVVERVYHEYKTFGSSNISYVPKRLTFKSDGTIALTSFDPDSIEEKDKKEIEKIVDEYIINSPFTLVQATHDHYPWKKDEALINAGTHGLSYDKSELKDFFKNNPSAFEVK
ncbi:Panacea domain-containing protein [Bacillus benzoevorans]|uniref:Putative phage-associated protein n=1 Tax=Bacillus benzoevorans TaxID=1456 RepID=A0A7X0HVM7_9BACI|nr:type II toxin-antitoxin system antitoxin SocA domain-containing protein [Bacillus benzoevorans]MBB6446436.1 putative phage-associated protein [Bacillus benzoevorans]